MRWPATWQTSRSLWHRRRWQRVTSWPPPPGTNTSRRRCSLAPTCRPSTPASLRGWRGRWSGKPSSRPRWNRCPRQAKGGQAGRGCDEAAQGEEWQAVAVLEGWVLFREKMQYDQNNIIKASDSVCETQLRCHSLDFNLQYLCYKLEFKLGS